TTLREQSYRFPLLNSVGRFAGWGAHQAVRILLAARNAMTKDRTRSVNALNAIVRSNQLNIDARHKFVTTQIQQISQWRTRAEELSKAVARTAARRLAQQIQQLNQQLQDNNQQLVELVEVSEVAPLLEEKGFQAISAAKCLVSWSHHGRVNTEAEFASLAGVNPIPASSGNTPRYRLNRGGARELNSALRMVAIVKATYDPETQRYVERDETKAKPIARSDAV